MIPGLDSIAAKIATGAALALFLALGVVMWRADVISGQRDDLRDDLATCEARHAVTRQSVATLEAAIAQMNERALSRAEAYAAAQAEAAKRSAELAELSRESDQRIARLRQLAREQVNGDCPVPAELRELAEGL